MHRTDSEIQRDVTAELRWDPSLSDDDIAVSVKEGIVTLAGWVKSYVDKWHAERVVGRVRGVLAVANDLDVRLPSSSNRTDPEIARAAVDALKWNISVPNDRVRLKVEHGWVTLEGEVDAYYQKDAAERSVRYLTGVKGVTNLITLKAHATAPDVKRQIKETLQRNARVDADHINVDVNGNTSVLTGTVRSFAELLDAEHAALNAPGIITVENRLTVDPGIYASV